MSSAVHSLQQAICEGTQSLTQLLRQTKLIAAKLSLADVEKWVDYELKGYPNDVEPPDCRKYTTSYLEIRNPVRGWDFAGNFTHEFRAPLPIAEIENLSKGESLTMTLAKQIPVRDSLGTGMGSQWPQRVIIAGSEFKNILEAVRNELLQWAVELEKRGINGEGMNFDEKEKQSAANQVFNVFGNVHGTVGNISNSQVTVYDYSSVQQLLIDRKIPKQERRELEDILDELKEAPAEKKPSLIKRGEDWIVKHKEFLETAAEAVGKAIGAAVKQ
jgi:hypothetical protein